MRCSRPRVFYRQQMRRIVELVEQCDDAQSVVAVLQAAVYCIKKTEARPSCDEASPINIAELNRSVLH